MAIQSGMFRSDGGDRKYKAAFFASYFASFIGNGVFPNPSSGLQVTPSANLNTAVRAGKAWINGYYMINDSDYILSHDIADGVLSRIDRVVTKLNFLTREITIEIKKGLPSLNPVAPTLQRDSDIYELGLADVRINNGATSINAANITDLRLNTQLCGIVQGVVNQVDTTTIFNQYQVALQNLENDSEISFENFLSQKQNEFDVFFQNVQDTLDGDTAGNLYNLIYAIDNSKGQPNGFAGLDSTGKVPLSQLPNIIPQDASLTQKGIVQLNNTTNSTSVTQAATPNSVKTVNDLVNSVREGNAFTDIISTTGLTSSINNNEGDGVIYKRITMPSGANYKIDILLPNETFYGKISVTLIGNFNNVDATGIATKSFQVGAYPSVLLQVKTTTEDVSQRLANVFTIGSYARDTVLNKNKIKIAKLINSAESVAVKIQVTGGLASGMTLRNYMKSIEVSAPYNTDTEVLPPLTDMITASTTNPTYNLINGFQWQVYS